MPYAEEVGLSASTRQPLSPIQRLSRQLNWSEENPNCGRRARAMSRG
jgi:hypothetical protein